MDEDDKAKGLERAKARIAESLRAGREKRGVTQDVIADELGLKQPTISSLEAGETLPRLVRLRDIARAYGLSVEALVP